MSSNKKLKIKIFDKEFTLVVEDEERAKDVSAYVNSLMNDLSTDMMGQPPQTIATVAALNIANDLYIEKDLANKTYQEATERLNKLNLLLEGISE
ncbi:MAG: cell division protein ZapA [Ignavibacteria bacterium]|nr:cell division protein ZapA [Ignavibacteria bacterium]